MTLPPEDRDLIERVLGYDADENVKTLLLTRSDLSNLLAAARAEAAPVVSAPSSPGDGWEPRASTGGQATLIDGKIEISIDVAALPMIVNGSCCCDSMEGLWKVTDAETFAKEVCRALNDEREDGTTRVHMMFDAAFMEAINQGAEGVEEVDEEAFGDETARLMAHPLPAALSTFKTAREDENTP